MRSYHVYILSSHSRTLYIGVTGNLHRRISEHKNKLMEGFTSKYNIHKLVYIEQFSDINLAIDREKQLKRWRREKKINLIIKNNPNWDDIYIPY